MYDKQTIYLEWIGGQWECRYWHTDEMRYYRFTDCDRWRALSKAIRDTGYGKDQCRIVIIGERP